jgi:5-carboxymethyl-2-hydroxymuconate isomerase
MPQIIVDHSESLSAAFDATALAHDLHSAAVEVAAAKPEACKTLFRPCRTTAIGFEADGHAVLHVTIGLLAGRTDETKARLTETVLEALRKHVRPTEGVALHVSAEVRELDASYRKFDA